MSAPVTTRPGRGSRSARPAERVRRSARPLHPRPGADDDAARSGAATKAYQRRARRLGQDPSAPRRRIARRIPFIALLIGICVAGLGLALWLNTSATARSYGVTEARAANEDLRNQRAALEQIVEAGNSAPELAARAAELGLVQGRDIARLIVTPEGEVHLVGEPVAADGEGPRPLTHVGRPAPKPAPPPPPPPAEEPAPAPPVDRVDPEADRPAPAPDDHRDGEPAPPPGDQEPAGEPVAEPHGAPAPPAAPEEVAP